MLPDWFTPQYDVMVGWILIYYFFSNGMTLMGVQEGSSSDISCELTLLLK